MAILNANRLNRKHIIKQLFPRRAHSRLAAEKKEDLGPLCRDRGDPYEGFKRLRRDPETVTLVYKARAAPASKPESSNRAEYCHSAKPPISKTARGKMKRRIFCFLATNSM